METASPPLQQNSYFRALSTALLKSHPTDSNCEGVDALVDMNFKWVVWRPNIAPEAARASVQEALIKCLLLATTEDERMLFQVPTRP